MMRKKQISRMLIGALTVCLATACSNETDVLTGLRTDGNTLSVNLQTTDVGVTTRTQIASDGESNVESLSAYLFDNDEGRGYQLEKVYNNLTWNENDPAHTVALTGIAKRGPKKVYFVANGGSVTALGNVGTGISETDFKALLMNEMKENPATPLTMTAEAELAEWIEGANNVTIQKTVQLKRVSARIDLVVAPQAGLTFTVKDIKMKSRANSYLFPNDAPYTGEDVVELTGTAGEGSTDADGNTAYTSLLYPYETPGGVVTEVEVSGSVQAGEVTKEVTFAVPFTNETYADGIPIERNHRYTVQIARIDGFYSAEATITVSDWSTGEASGNLLAGEELKMTATEEISGQLSDEPTATAVYPTDDSKTVTVELAADDAKIYKIYVGSANIEAVTSWGELPNGWTIAEPASTRTEYLWEKSYWTLTVPANETDAAKSVTIKAVNKLEKDDTDKFVQITFTQAGKEEVVDHSKNPLLKWAEKNSINYLQKQYGSSQQWWTLKYEYSSSDYPESDWDNGIGSYYQWGRNAGFPFPTNYNLPYSNTGGISWVKVTSALPTKKVAAKTANQHLFLINGDGNDYVSDGTTTETWTDRTSKLYNNDGNASYNNPRPWPCPEGYRLPTTAEYLYIMPKKENQTKSFTSLVELKTLEDGTKYAIRWAYSDDNSTFTVGSAWNEHLTINCLIVPNTCTDPSSVDWSDSHVVTRVFYTGGSRLGAYYGSHSNPTNPAPVTFDWDNTAYYWTSESASVSGTAWVMTFRTTRRDDDQTGNYGPWFQIAAYPKDNAQLVRCIKID